MTSHNIGDAQRPPGVPLSTVVESSGTGGCASLRSAAIHHRALCEVMPSLRGGLPFRLSRRLVASSRALLWRCTPGPHSGAGPAPGRQSLPLRGLVHESPRPRHRDGLGLRSVSACPAPDLPASHPATVPRPPERVPHREPEPDGAPRVPRSLSPPVSGSPCGCGWIPACVEMLRLSPMLMIRRPRRLTLRAAFGSLSQAVPRPSARSKTKWRRKLRTPNPAIVGKTTSSSSMVPQPRCPKKLPSRNNPTLGIPGTPKASDKNPKLVHILTSRLRWYLFLS